MASNQKLKEEYNITKAFHDLFMLDGKLKPEAEIVIAFLRDECGARGELGKSGLSYFYDRNNRFDQGAAAFLLGKRRVFDLIIKHLAISESKIFALLSEKEKGFSSEDVLEYQLEV